MLAMLLSQIYYDHMTPIKFEAQPHYEEGIYDRRVLDVVGQLAVISQEKELKKPIRRPWDTEDEPKPISRYDIPDVNTIETLHVTGRDGEMASGGIGLIAVTTEDGKSLAAIQSGYYDHETGLPLNGRSWSAEFDDIDLAEGFWKRHWKPSFVASNFIDSINELKKTKGNIPQGSIRFQQLGLLKPWYGQKEDELILLDEFSTTNDALVSLPKNYLPDPSFNVGQVYKVPSRDWENSRNKSSFEAKTCMAAFKSVIKTWDNYPTELRKSSFVQWSDGVISAYDPLQHQVTPLQKADITQQKPKVTAA